MFSSANQPTMQIVLKKWHDKIPRDMKNIDVDMANILKQLRLYQNCSVDKFPLSHKKTLLDFLTDNYTDSVSGVTYNFFSFIAEKCSIKVFENALVFLLSLEVHHDHEAITRGQLLQSLEWSETVWEQILQLKGMNHLVDLHVKTMRHGNFNPVEEKIYPPLKPNLTRQQHEEFCIENLAEREKTSNELLNMSAFPERCELFLMSPASSDQRNISDLKHLYLYKNKRDEIFYQIKDEVHGIQAYLLEDEKNPLTQATKQALTGDGLFLMSSADTRQFSDRKRLYLYKDKEDRVFYQIKDEKGGRQVYLLEDEKNQLTQATKKALTFSQPASNPVRHHDVAIVKEILAITSRRGHTSLIFDQSKNNPVKFCQVDIFDEVLAITSKRGHTFPGRAITAESAHLAKRRYEQLQRRKFVDVRLPEINAKLDKIQEEVEQRMSPHYLGIFRKRLETSTLSELRQRAERRLKMLEDRAEDTADVPLIRTSFH